MIGHPGERRLLAFQDGRLPDAARRRLAGHLADCQQCRDVVQGHRAVRAVLRLDTPFAPDGVLERILASRDQGALVVLPVVDPAPGRRPVRGVVGLAMALAAVLVIALVPVIPMTPLAGAWKWWIGFIVDWHPFSNTANGPRPELLKAPMAEPMVFDPSRMKPYEAKYVTTQRYPNYEGGIERIMQKIDTSVIRVTDARATTGEWITYSSERERFRGDGTVTLDPGTLAPHTWTTIKGVKFNYRREVRYRLVGNELTRDVWYGGIVPPNMVNVMPPGLRSFTIPNANHEPFSVDETDILSKLTTVRLGRRWSGSALIFMSSGFGETGSWDLVTYFVDGSVKYTTPAGTFDAWMIRSINESGDRGFRMYVRKSDGLYLGFGAEDRREKWEYSRLLLSTTLDAPTATAH